MVNEKISMFKSLNAKPESIELRSWLERCKNGNSNGYAKQEKQVKQYRKTGKDELKTSLPLITVGAVCEGGRKMENVKTRTGWIALDIDDVEDAELVRDKIAEIKFVAFAGLSTGGKGIWVLVKIKDPRKQSDYFEQLKADFQAIGIKLDPSKGKNPNDARFYSYDADAIIKEDFSVYDRLPVSLSRRANREKPYAGKHSDQHEKTERWIDLIESQEYDITKNYDQWFRLGFAFADEFGEKGRDYFHSVSQFYKDYDFDEANDKYDDCLRADCKYRGKPVTIGTFYDICNTSGLQIRTDFNPEPKGHIEVSDNGSDSLESILGEFY